MSNKTNFPNLSDFPEVFCNRKSSIELSHLLQDKLAQNIDTALEQTYEIWFSDDDDDIIL